ncbi:MAG: hypothetical protein V1663_03315 [archaeon]
METIELGGNINLVGFKAIEPQQLVVVKKIVGNFVKKIQTRYKEFNSLVLDLKSIHNSESQISAKIMIDNKNYNVEVTDFNLFFALNKALKKIEEQIPQDL